MKRVGLGLCLWVASSLISSAWAVWPDPGIFLQPDGGYLGQKPPGKDPEIFAPGVVNTGMYTRDVAIVPEGNEIYWTATVGNWTITTILFSKREGGHWTAPEVAPFATDPRAHHIEPCISPDGQKFFFASDRPGPKEGEDANFDIYVMERKEGGWSEPQNLGPTINTSRGEFFPSVTKDGTLYFTRDDGPASGHIWRARWVDGHYAAPQKLPSPVNQGASQFNAFVAADESYLVFSVPGRRTNLGSVDYYVVFRSGDDSWSDPVNLGPAINGRKCEGYSSYVSRDGKYFFFASARTRKDLFGPGEKLTCAKLRELHNTGGNGTSAIYWMDAGFIADLRPPPPEQAPPASQ